MKFRKKPVVIEAVQFTPNDGPFPEGFLRREDYNPFVCVVEVRDGENVLKVPPLHAAIRTPEGLVLASPGDWIIKGVKGEFYPCKPDIFAATYEPAPSEPESGPASLWSAKVGKDPLADLNLPSEPAPVEGDGARAGLLPEIAAFARVMDAKVKGHDIDRGEYGWRTASPARLMEWLDRYVEALRDAVTLPSLARDPAKVTSKAANIANLAMMIADVAGDLDAAATPEPLRMSPAEYDRAVEILKDETPPPAGLIDLFTPSEPAAEFCTKCGAEGVEPHRGECLPTTAEGDGARGNVHKENDR